MGEFRPSRLSGSGAFEFYSASFAGIDVLAMPASEVITLPSRLDTLGGDDFGFRVIAPRLSLELARQTVPEHGEDDDGRYFTSVLTAYPGTMDVVV